MEEENKEINEKEEELKKVEAAPENPLIDEAKRVNEERREILEREEKLQDRKEKFHAEEMVAGKAKMQEGEKEETPKEYADRVMKNDI